MFSPLVSTFLLIGVGSFLVVLFLVAPDQISAGRAARAAVLALAAIIAWLLHSRGQIEAAALVLVVGTWTYVTAVCIFTGGLHATPVLIYPLIIMMTGWRLGGRAAAAVAGLTVATCVGLFLAETSGVLPAAPATPTASLLAVQIVVFVFAAYLVSALVRSYRGHLDDLTRLSDELTRRTLELEEGKAELDRAQAVGNVGSWNYDIATDTMRFSAEACRIFGLREGTRGSVAAYMELVHPDDRGTVDHLWQAALNGQAFDHEHRLVMGQKLSWVRQKTELEFAANGTPMHAVGIVQDITERKQVGEELRISEQKLHSILESVDACIYLKDVEGRYLYANRPVRELWQVEMKDIIGFDDTKFFDPATAANIWRTDRRVLEAGETLRLEEIDTVSITGKTAIYQSAKLPLRRKDGSIYALCGISTDITARKEMELALSEREAQLRTLIEAVPDSIQFKDGEGRWLVANTVCLNLFGLEGNSWQGLSDTEIGIRYPQLAAGMASCKASDDLAWSSGQSIFRTDEHVMDVQGNGNHFDVIKVPLFDDRQQRHALAIVGRNVTERKQMEAEVHHLGFYDALTNLPNRRLLADRLRQTMAASSRSGFYCALMFLDLDNFKPLNDLHGHVVGDLLLIEAANRLKSCVRETDTVARFGGDEFVVLVNELMEDRAESVAQTTRIAEKIRSSLAKTYLLALKREEEPDTTVEHHCTVSIGVALFIDRESSQDDVLNSADKAMYQAKDAGRNQIWFDSVPE